MYIKAHPLDSNYLFNAAVSWQLIHSNIFSPLYLSVSQVMVSENETPLFFSLTYGANTLILLFSKASLLHTIDWRGSCYSRKTWILKKKIWVVGSAARHVRHEQCFAFEKADQVWMLFWAKVRLGSRRFHNSVCFEINNWRFHSWFNRNLTNSNYLDVAKSHLHRKGLQ